MKTIPPALLAYLQATGGAEVATCWKMTLTDSTVMGFTDHDKDLVVDTVTYSAKTGYNRTAIASNSSLAVDNVDLEGAIAAAGITNEDIRAGLYDYAQVEVFMVNATNVSLGKVILRRGVLGELTLKSGIYVTEIRGLAQFLQRQSIRVFTPECNARIYDSRCTVDPTNFTNTGLITSITTPNKVIVTTLSGTSRPIGYFSGGLITFTSGNANGRSMEVRDHAASDTLTLLLPMTWDLQVGDTFSIRRGCDQTLTTCQDVFDNVLNHRGFPKVPGSDRMIWYPDNKN